MYENSRLHPYLSKPVLKLDLGKDRLIIDFRHGEFILLISTT